MVRKKTAKSKLRRAMEPFLVKIDAVYASVQMPLRHRALQAALDFAKGFVLRVEGGTKDKPIGQPWFDAIHFEALSWYQERYVEAMSENPDGESHAVVFFAGAVFSLTFPLLVDGPGSAPLTRRIYFPRVLRDDEDPFAFLDARLELATFAKRARNQLKADISRVVGQTRSLNMALRFADVPEAGRQLANRVMWTLTQAVASISRGQSDRYALAVWELNLVAELALKVFLMQGGHEIPRIHGVRKIHSRAVQAGLEPIDPRVLAAFPSERKAIRCRYGEVSPPPLATLLALYGAALAVSLHAASPLRHSFSVGADGWIEIRSIGALARAP